MCGEEGNIWCHVWDLQETVYGNNKYNKIERRLH